MTMSTTYEPDLPIAALKQIDRLCSQFEAAWDKDSPPDLHDFLEDAGVSAGKSRQHTELFRSQLFRELLLADLEQRQTRNLAVTRQSYVDRFPNFTEVIQSAFLDFEQDRHSELPHLSALQAACLASGTVKLLPKKIGVYERGPCIGRGAMGVIYRGRDTRLGRDVAIKMMSRRCLDKPDLLGRFQHEAGAIAKLSHPNIVVLHDIGCQPIEGVGVFPYAVMELLDGDNLRKRLKRPVTVNDAVDIVRQIAEALSAAHRLGIVHRDIKPENVMLVGGTLVKVLDFGLAKTILDVIEGDAEPEADDDHVSTQQGKVLGTYGYMAPERVLGGAGSAASDLFSLTCVLFELLTGVPPFHRPSAADVASATLQDDPLAPPNSSPHVAEVLHRLPGPLFQLLRDGFEKDAAARISSASEYVKRLQDVRLQDELRPSSAGPRISPAIDSDVVATSRTRRRIGIAIAVIIALAVVFVAAALMQDLP